MKIVFCANTSWYIYNFRKNLISAIKNKGYEVYAISPPDNYTSSLHQLGVKWFGIRLHQTSKNPITEIRTVIQLLYLIRTIQPDFLLTFTIKCNLYAGFLKKICNFRHIVNISGLGEVFDKKNISHRLACSLYRTALKHSQKVFFQNNEDLQMFIQQGILPTQLCERLPGSGVDLLTFTPLPQKNRDEKTHIFLIFGRIIPSKGYALFLEAAQRIKKVQNNQVEFWILGIKDTSRKDSLRLFKKILEYHDRKIIKYFPPTDNVVPILQRSDVVVLPSQYNEGVPKSLLEAMACGKPIITTHWKGCRDTVEHGINGYLIGKDDLLSLEKYMNFFIHADNEILQKMGKASREKAEREFDEKFVIAKYFSELHNSS